MAEITAPIITITFVLAAVFVPVAFIPGLTGRLYNQFALTIVFSFVLSAINSLTFSPAMSRLFLKPRKHGESGFILFRWFNKGMSWLENSYDSILDFTAHHWWTIVLPSLGLLALTAFMIAQRPKAFIPVEDQGYVFVVVQTPDGTTQEPTKRVMARVSEIAQKVEGVTHVVRLDGLNPLTNVNQPNAGACFVILEPWEERSAPQLRARAIAQKLQMLLLKEIQSGRRAGPSTASDPGSWHLGGLRVPDRGPRRTGRPGPRPGYRLLPRRGPQTPRARTDLHPLLRQCSPAPLRP